MGQLGGLNASGLAQASCRAPRKIFARAFGLRTLPVLKFEVDFISPSKVSDSVDTSGLISTN